MRSPRRAWPSWEALAAGLAGYALATAADNALPDFRNRSDGNDLGERWRIAGLFALGGGAVGGLVCIATRVASRAARAPTRAPRSSGPRRSARSGTGALAGLVGSDAATRPAVAALALDIEGAGD